MSALLEATLAHLRVLVSFDTRNPPRKIDSGGVFDYLRAQLPGFECTVTDHGAGAVSLLARRGQPNILFNVHLDTVPDSPHWSASPLLLRVDGERAFGLGACDIKGAAAALLAAVAVSDGDVALLFTSDEEGTDPRCIRGVLDARHESKRSPEKLAAPAARPSGHRLRRCSLRHPAFAVRVPAFDLVIVAEPTGCRAVLAHRGIQSVRMRFQGRAGHASGAQQPADSAVHQAVRWGAAALDYAEARAHEQFGELHGLRCNIGRIEGGIKPNMIAADAELRFGLRPLPSMDPDSLLRDLRALAEPAAGEFAETFRGPPLPAGQPALAESRWREARTKAERLGLPIGAAVDFWTEAALFSQAGYTACVFGPGEIAQAHSADEWVALPQLALAAETYQQLLAKRS